MQICCKHDLDSRLRGNDLFFKAVSESVIPVQAGIQSGFSRMNCVVIVFFVLNDLPAKLRHVYFTNLKLRKWYSFGTFNRMGSCNPEGIPSYSRWFQPPVEVYYRV